MENKKILKSAKATAALLLVAGLTSSVSEDRFQKVIDNAANETVKNKLIDFKKGGVEQSVSLAEYDAENVIAYARTFQGTPHQMGGTTLNGIDCSGLVMVTHARFGVKLPHSSHEQARYGTIIPEKENLQKGDLVFFFNSYNSRNFITHSGIYIGEGEFIHTSDSKGVIISKIDDPYYWNERYLFATRLRD